MGAFVFDAVDAAGRRRRGVIEAGSADGARRRLRDDRLVPVSVGPRAHRPRRLAPGALATLMRQLATLVGSDVRIDEALRLVAAQSPPTVAPVLLAVRGAILDGQAFAAALAAHPAAFPDHVRAAVAAGEQSGRLGDVLAHLADFVEARHRSGRRLALALVYPALLALVSTAMMAALLVYVIPDIARVFTARGADLPVLTRAVIALSDGLRDGGLPALGAMAVVAVAARRWLTVAANRLRIDRILATARPTAGLVRRVAAARFVATLATLVRSDVPLVAAIAAAAAVTPNRHIRAAAIGVGARVREGTSLARAMAMASVFPPMLVAVVASGEASGRLGAVLARAARDLDRDLDALTATLMGLIEPAVLLLMGGVVLLLVLSILLPIITLNDLAGM